MTRGGLVVTALVASVACVHAETHIPDGEAASYPGSLVAARELHPRRPADPRPHCFACHGPDENQGKAKLRLDRKETPSPSTRGTAVRPGSVTRARPSAGSRPTTRPSRCPPAARTKRLQPEQIDVLKRWVEQGAKWEPHWAFVKPVRAGRFPRQRTRPGPGTRSTASCWPGWSARG